MSSLLYEPGLVSPESTFWLTVEIQIQLIFILIGVVIFFTTPRSGKLEYFELGLVLVIAAISDIVSTVGHHVLHTNMNLVSNIYNIVAFPAIVSLYRKRIHWKNTKALAITIIVLFVLFGLINLFFIQKPLGVNSYTNSLYSAFYIVMSLTYFYVLIQQLPTESITRLPMFWINTGVLIYYSGIFFMDLTADYLINVLKDKLIVYWFIYYLIGLIYYSILWYALLLIRSEHRRKGVLA